MLFSDITDCEMLAFRFVQRSDRPVSMVEVMEALNEQYETEWSRSTVCTFLVHLVQKGYLKSERRGRVFYYSSAINDRKFILAQTKAFLDFFYDGNGEEMIRAVRDLQGV